MIIVFKISNIFNHDNLIIIFVVIIIIIFLFNARLINPRVELIDIMFLIIKCNIN